MPCPAVSILALGLAVVWLEAFALCVGLRKLMEKEGDRRATEGNG